MSRPTTISAATARAKPGAGRNALPGRLSPSMACDTAFRIIARRHLGAFLAQHDGTCRGDPEALHQIRIALTHLRTAIRFFSPMVDDAIQPNVWAELKWLNSQLGMVRDLDVAIERVVAESGDELAVIAELQHWDEKRAESHRLLVRALQSARYRRLVEQTSAWIESGPWSTQRSKEAVKSRRCSLCDHATAQLTKWEGALLRRARKLRKLDGDRRHKLRLFNKRLTYSVESLEDLFADESLTKQKSILKQLRKAQRSLGKLNDDARGQVLAATLNGAGPKAGIRFLNRKREKKLLQAASTAYRKLNKAKPLRSLDLARNSEPED
jgi:CHAD domain-containing protein